MTSPEDTATVTAARSVMKRLVTNWPAWTSPDVIADDMGTSREHVERVLTMLVRGGQVARDGSTYRIAGKWVPEKQAGRA